MTPFVLALLAAAPVVAEQVTALERWLPTITSIGGVLVIALVTAFKMGAKVNTLQSAVAQLSTNYDELKAVVKEGFSHAREERKELQDDARSLETKQTELGKDVEYQGRMCTTHERRIRETEPVGGM